MKKRYFYLLTIAIVIGSIIISGCLTSQQASQSSSTNTSTATTNATTNTSTTTSIVKPTPSASPTATPTPSISGTIATRIQFAQDPGSVQRGQPISLNIAVTAPGQSKPMICGNHGTVTVTRTDDSVIGTVTLVMPDNSGDCFYTAKYNLDTNSLSPGTYNIVLKYSGDSTYQPSQSTSAIIIK